MPTFYAAFPDSYRARRMVRELLEDGIQLDDISLVVAESANGELSEPGSIGDSSFFVGRADDPEHDLVDESSPGADYEAVEVSEVGGGISTSDRGKNVDSVDQMDDSQSAAEDMIWPRGDASNSSHELDDLNRAVRTGYPSPVTPLDADPTSPSEADRSFETIQVPGVGAIIGGGDLSTAAMDWAGKDGPDSAAFLTYLQDEGVPPATANELLSRFGEGGSLLAVALVPEVDENALEIAAERNGAVATGSFAAHRY